jgi:hypothetical protein
MTIPTEISALLRGFPHTGVREQAFPFLSVDENGFPHSALLSRAELEPTADCETLLAAVASSRTRTNVRRSGVAALIAVDGSVCHHVKLRLVGSLIDDDVLGCEFALVEHKRDDIGIPLQALMFRTSAELAVHENWARSAAMFTRLLDARASREGRR